MIGAALSGMVVTRHAGLDVAEQLLREQQLTLVVALGRAAAEYGIGALVHGFAGLRRACDDAITERTGENFVSTEVNDRFVALCPTTVLGDRERAIKTGIRGQRFFAQAIGHWYDAGPRDHVPDPDGHHRPGNVHGDHPAVGTARHPAFPRTPGR